MRHEQTEAEKAVWQKLRNSQLGVKFRRQVPVGPYFADFLCAELKLIVEIDGGQHAESEKDAARTEYLTRLGFYVQRYWNSDVMENFDGVADDLKAVIAELLESRSS